MRSVTKKHKHALVIDAFNFIFDRFLDYVSSDPSGRTLEDTVVIQVKQGYEPLNFTGHFQAWDRDKWSASITSN